MEQAPPQAAAESRHDSTAISTLSPVPLTDDKNSNPETVTAPKRRLQLSTNRLLSLDLLRGLAILLMITCNAQTGDDVFPIMTHPEWIGFTIADTIFPSFLFITGVTMPLSIRADPNPTPGSHYYRNHALRVFKRSVIIWLLGVILNLYGLVQLHVGPDQFRWPNVLNRIGFCYLVVGWMHVLVLWRGKQPEKPLSFSYLFAGDARPQTTSTIGDSKKDLSEEKQEPTEQDDSGPWPWFFRVTLPYYLPVACLVIWLICTYTVQVEGCPERAMIRDPECSPQAYFDLIIFGKAHTYRHLAFDPEGSLSTLTSILNVWFGWFIGCTVHSLNAQVKQLTKDFKTRQELRGNDTDDQASLVEQILEQEILVRLYTEHLGQWFWWGLLWMFTGWIFSFGLPLSKPSWTATYAVLSAGVSQTMLAILFFKFDVQPLSKRLRQLHLEHQGFRSNNQLSHHYRHRASDLEHPTGTTGRTNYSGALNVYFQVDHFLRCWFRKGIIVVLGSMGRNAILMYMCSELIQGTCYLAPGGPADPVTGEKLDLFTTVYNKTWGKLDIGGWGSLFYGMGFAALHVLLAIFLDYKKWYFKV
ncbi:hypothetical protein B0O80DRAFT_493590 [Mortierella sp. GBAus27b]|nr:hypothetical protein BGX31_000482 [Mortierella sp. GBA43]KAI8360959.1 hypothetical protein B0O80DRAFT_493590 [Mortierella sp. GBAus27b]